MSDRLGEYLIENYDFNAKEANLAKELFFERSQLYGSLITIMLKHKTNSFKVSREDLAESALHFLTFTPESDGDFVTLTLKDREDVTI